MTPEEQAEEWADERQTRLPTELDCQWYLALEEAFLAGYEAAQPQWISVKDRLPERCGGQIVSGRAFDGSQFVAAGTYDLDINEWLSDDYHFRSDQITHWMPLPKPPKEEK